MLGPDVWKIIPNHVGYGSQLAGDSLGITLGQNFKEAPI